jgi:hypothetical protein
MHKDQLIGAKSKAATFAFSVTKFGVDVEPIANGQRIESTINELLSGEFIDRDVTPMSARNRLARREFNDVCVAVALPRRVVVMPNGWQTFASPRHR